VSRPYGTQAYEGYLISTNILSLTGQGPLGVDRVAGQQFQARIQREQLFQMIFQTAWLVGFIAANGPTGEVELERLSEDIEHENRIAVLIFHLFLERGSGTSLRRRTKMSRRMDSDILTSMCEKQHKPFPSASATKENQSWFDLFVKLADGVSAHLDCGSEGFPFRVVSCRIEHWYIFL